MNGKKVQVEHTQPQAAEPAAPYKLFRTTHWSVVLAARLDDSAALRAMNALCSAYWFPAYAYIRRRGYGADEAQDLTQSFFEHVLVSKAFQKANPSKGRFRSYLLGALNNFLSHAKERAMAKKRGGGCEMVPLDFSTAENQFVTQPTGTEENAERQFDREWALAVLNAALDRLRDEYTQARNESLFLQLKASLAGERQASTREIAERLGQSEGAVKVAVHRLRRRFREVLREEIGQTVAAASDVEDEMRYLFSVLEGD